MKGLELIMNGKKNRPKLLRFTVRMNQLFFYEIMGKEKEIPGSHEVRLRAAEVRVAVSEKGSVKMLTGLDGKSLTSQVVRLP